MSFWPTDPNGFVTLVIVFRDETQVAYEMNPFAAVLLIQDPDPEWAHARIIPGKVDMGNWDRTP